MTFKEKIKMKIDGCISGILAQNTGKEAVGEKKIIDGTAELCREAAAEGIVLLENDGILPIKRGAKVAVFGRCAFDYFCVGYGSGGDVHPPYKVNLIEALRESGVFDLDEAILNYYEEWRKQNPTNEGFWGHWPFSHPEAEIDEKTVVNAAATDDVAIVVIGRAAGEDRENSLSEGSYYLTKNEKSLLKKVTSSFEHTVLVLDCGNIIDLAFVKEYNISAVLYAWQGGMEGCRALVDVLDGKVNPSAKLTDTIAKSYKDYPSANNFGDKAFNNYVEDIFVGYRYFETFAQEKVLYSFGYGLSYTQFSIENGDFVADGKTVKIQITVKNIGNTAGKEIVQFYVSAPQGKLGKASKILVAFKKTPLLSEGESFTFTQEIPYYAFASYDDGIGDYASCYVLENGEYAVYVGNSIKTQNACGKFIIEKTTVLQKREQVMAVKDTFLRYEAKQTDGKVVISQKETPPCKVDLRTRILNNLPEEISFTGDKGYKLSDVKRGEVTLDEFIAQLTVDELARLTCGEGAMDSKLGAAGNAGAMCGVSEKLRQKGIPAVITTDGPSGIRLLCYVALFPCGTCLASTWNEELVERLTEKLGEEMKLHHSDILLAPGMNIHRDPLCGRNFEYFSEDPVLSGKMAAAYVRGVQKSGLSACPKHFVCNNQETNRNRNDSRVSERALREIYLKGFEICVKEASPKNIMTSYNKVNGVWSHYNYDLNTTVLRGEWNYKGNVMTDWWMQKAVSPEFNNVKNNAYRVRAQVDVLMPGSINYFPVKIDNSIKKSYNAKGITLGELQRTAKNILSLALNYCD